MRKFAEEFLESMVRGDNKCFQMWSSGSNCVFQYNFKREVHEFKSWKNINIDYSFINNDIGIVTFNFDYPTRIWSKLCNYYSHRFIYKREPRTLEEELLKNYILWILDCNGDTLKDLKKKAILRRLLVDGKKYRKSFSKQYLCAKNNGIWKMCYLFKDSLNARKNCSNRLEFNSFILNYQSLTDKELTILKKVDINISEYISKFWYWTPKVYWKKDNDANQKAAFVNPEDGNIYISNIKLSETVLQHELLHSYIYRNKYWSNAFLREGFAEGFFPLEYYRKKINKSESICCNIFTSDKYFWNISEITPVIAGLFIKYLIEYFDLPSVIEFYEKCKTDEFKSAFANHFKKDFSLMKSQFCQWIEKNQITEKEINII